MKINFKFALMCAATLAMVACGDPNNGGGGHHEEEEEEEGFESIISVKDNSIADWNNVPAEFLAEAKHEGCTQWDKLKSVKVYADEMYINILAEYDGEFYQDPERLTYEEGGEIQEYYSSLHIYLDADNSDATGGYGDEFADANAEVNLECGFLSAGKHINWDPAYFKWWGEVGADGWEWTDPANPGTDENYWGAIIGTGMGAIANSQQPAPGVVEIQILRESLESAGVVFAETFGLGMDIQFNWESVGVLPNAADDAAGSTVKAAKLKVTIDRTEK